MILASLLALTLSGPPEEVPAPKVEAFVLDVESISRTEFGDALELRLPDRPQLAKGDLEARSQFGLYGYVQIRPDRGTWVLALIVIDKPGAKRGRAYYRDLDGEPDQIPRLAASTLANLVAGIEADTVRPDKEDVPIPVEPPKEDDGPKDPPPEPPPGPPPPRPEGGLRIGGGVVLGVGPPSPMGLSAGGIDLGFALRGVQGGLFGIGVRGAGRGNTGFGLARFRVSVLGGYSYRKGMFELVVAGGLAAEPWFVQREGSREPIRLAGAGEQRSSFLLGGFARVAPGFRKKFSDKTAFALAPVIEIGGSAVPARNGGVARVREGDQTLFRAGGLELWGGLELGFWFELE